MERAGKSIHTDDTAKTRHQKRDVAVNPYISVPVLLNNSPIQRKAGCACGGGCSGCQAKSSNLPVSQPNDASEIEADQIADKVIRMETSKPVNLFSTENSIQKKESRSDSNAAVPPVVHDVINSSVGKSMDDNTRSFMESRFNYDFSDVKIHDDGKAAESADSINALAYTTGKNIIFNSGQYNTNSESGRRLMAHELTHVVQQNSTVRGRVIQRKEMPNTAEALQQSPTTPLQVGQVVRVEVRLVDIEPMTNNYPVSPNGCVNLPMVGCIMAKGKTTTQLRSDITAALIKGVYKDPIVNVSTVGKTVDYKHRVVAGESIFIRVLGSAGNVEFSGDFPVDSSGQIHIPLLKDMSVLNQTFDTIETNIRNGLLKVFLVSPTVHVADSSL